MVVGAGLAAGMDGLKVAVQGASQAIRTGLNVYQDVGRSLINVQTGLVKGITGLDVSFNAFKTAFGNGLSASKSIQQQAAMVSQNLASVGTMFEGTIKDLPGLFTTRLQGALQLFEIGLHRNSGNLLSLTERIRAAGGDQRAATRQLGKIFKARGYDIQALEELGFIIGDAATRNSIGFDKLLGAVAGMTESCRGY